MLRCLIASLAIALWVTSCSFLAVMPRQANSALFASGAVPLTPTVTTCTVSTTFHPAPLSALSIVPYFLTLHSSWYIPLSKTCMLYLRNTSSTVSKTLKP
eukprot:1181674-Prorocentrum_minimum.AAC.1